MLVAPNLKSKMEVEAVAEKTMVPTTVVMSPCSPVVVLVPRVLRKRPQKHNSDFHTEGNKDDALGIKSKLKNKNSVKWKILHLHSSCRVISVVVSFQLIFMEWALYTSCFESKL